MIAHLWCYEVSEDKRKGQEQNPDPIARHVIPGVLVDIHIHEVRSIGYGDLNH